MSRILEKSNDVVVVDGDKCDVCGSEYTHGLTGVFHGKVITVRLCESCNNEQRKGKDDCLTEALKIKLNS